MDTSKLFPLFCATIRPVLALKPKTKREHICYSVIFGLVGLVVFVCSEKPKPATPQMQPAPIIINNNIQSIVAKKRMV